VKPRLTTFNVFRLNREQGSVLLCTKFVPTEEPDELSGKALGPSFVRVPADSEVSEGKMVRFDCRVSGRPYPEVTWYLNGRQILDDATHKILVNESGNHALMITSAQIFDSGVIQCIARNKGGEAGFQCRLSVVEKEQIVAPKFVERFTTVNVKEGEPVGLNVRAVGTPIPKLSWQKDGVPISSGNIHHQRSIHLGSE
jgi:titin